MKLSKGSEEEAEDRVTVFACFTASTLEFQEEEMLRPGEVRGPAALLIWCQRVTQAYYPDVNITNMSRC